MLYAHDDARVNVLQIVFLTGQKMMTYLPCCHLTFPGAIFVRLLLDFCVEVLMSARAQWKQLIETDGKRLPLRMRHVPSVTCSFNFGSVGFPFAETILTCYKDVVIRKTF